MRFTSYTVVDPSGRPCYHPDSANPLNLELELAQLQRETRGRFKLMVDIGDECAQVVGIDHVTGDPFVVTARGSIELAQ